MKIIDYNFYTLANISKLSGKYLEISNFQKIDNPNSVTNVSHKAS